MSDHRNDVLPDLSLVKHQRPLILRMDDVFTRREGVVRPQLNVASARQSFPPCDITHAMKAQQRLHQRFNHLTARKRPQIAAVARELVGFLWAVMQDVAVPASPAV